MKTKTLSAVALVALSTLCQAQTTVVSPVIDTGLFNIQEMSLDPANGDIYVNGFTSGSPTLSVHKVADGALVSLYATLPGTAGGNLGYTNGFAVHGANLWWNNANSGPGTATEFSQAPKTGGGPIVRNSPANDLDSLASDGTTLFSAHYAGSLYSVAANGSISSAGAYRGASHLALAAAAGVLYVADDAGIYRRNTNGTFASINDASSRYLTNGSRLGTGGGYVYALDRNNHNGYWKVDASLGSADFLTDPLFINLNAIVYYNGDVYVSDTGEASGQPNAAGHVWKIGAGFTLTASGSHGTVTGSGVYAPGATASLTASPQAGYVFVNWTGDDGGTANPLAVLMNANKTITAIFGEDTADTDSDGLTAYQEIVVYGTNPALADTDADGFADGYEVTRGFSPTSGGSSPESEIAFYPAVEVEFGAALGRTYRVESTTDFQTWTTVESGIAGNGGQISRLYSMRSSLRRYFRTVRE